MKRTLNTTINHLSSRNKQDEFYTQYVDIRNCQTLDVCKVHNKAKGNG